MPSSTSPFARFAWGTLAFNVAVILWGAYVRATGSGAGCGNHWPLCNGVVVPLAPATATVIEFTHRAMTGIDLPLVALLVVWAFRRFPRGHPARLGATLSGVFLVMEALIGAALVLLERVARNASAWYTSAHLLNTLTLLACLALTAWWGAGEPAVRARGRAAWLAGASLLAMALLGVSGAIAALGDTLFPPHTLAEGLAQDLNPAASVFVRLRVWHPAIAAIAGLWLLYYAASGGSKKLAWWLMSLVGLQVAAGVVNLLLLAPVWMQMLHLLLADLLWIVLVLLCAWRLQVPPTPADRWVDETGVHSGGLGRAGADPRTAGK